MQFVHNNILQKMSSLPVSPLSRTQGLLMPPNLLTTSPTTPPSHPSPQITSPPVSRQPPSHSSSETASRHPTTQSVIFHQRFPRNPQLSSTFSGLDSLARHVPSHLQEDCMARTHNSSEKTPFLRAPTMENTFSSVINRPPSFLRPYTGLEEKKNSAQTENKRRKESIESEVPRDKLKFTQRVIASNVGNRLNIGDQSTNDSQTGQNVKQFDFLKKRKEQSQKQLFYSSNLHQKGHIMKKSEFIWPVYTLPQDHKFGALQVSSKLQNYSNVLNPPAHPLSPQSAGLPQFQTTMQFRKKKQAQATSSSPPQQPSSIKNDLFSRFKSKPIQQPQKRCISISDFQLITKLGKGAFGEVYMAMQRSLGWLCVLKKMSKRRILENNLQQHITRQIKLQSFLNNSHLTSLYGYFTDQEHLYLVLELLPDGSLQQVKRKRKLPSKQTAEIVRQVALGLKYMHSQFVIHRDLKPQNVFINQNYVKIGDLGCSIYHNATGLRNTIVGCLEYSSPQQLSQTGYTDKIDSWSLGVLTYQLMFGRSPFQGDIRKMMLEGGPGQLPEVSYPSAPTITPQARDFINNLLHHLPDRRMDMDEVLHHEFLKENIQ